MQYHFDFYSTVWEYDDMHVSVKSPSKNSEVFLGRSICKFDSQSSNKG